jgi:hypothetical protein
VRERIAQSANQRTFWETAVLVTTSDDALTKGHVQYLEARLIDMARKANRVALDNDRIPQPDRRRLPEPDRANMEAFLANLQTILPVVGLDLFKPQPKPAPASALAGVAAAAIRPRFEIRHKSGVVATAEEVDGEFVVLAGSQARKDAGHAVNQYADLKRNLLRKQILAPSLDLALYEFKRDCAFKSVSAAAAVVLDRNANGRTEWKLAETGVTYDEWQRAQADVGIGSRVEFEPAL